MKKRMDITIINRLSMTLDILVGDIIRYYDVVLNCKDLLSAKWLNEFLREHGVQFKQSGVWLLYQKYAEKSYTSTKTHNYLNDNGGTYSKVHTYRTQKGRLFIYDLLKSHGYCPRWNKQHNSEVIPMHTTLDADKLCETSEYIESLSTAPDSTNGAELIEYAAELCREING